MYRFRCTIFYLLITSCCFSQQDSLLNVIKASTSLDEVKLAAKAISTLCKADHDCLKNALDYALLPPSSAHKIELLYQIGTSYSVYGKNNETANQYLKMCESYFLDNDQNNERMGSIYNQLATASSTTSSIWIFGTKSILYSAPR